MAKHNELGKWGEDFAADYLQKQGYVIRDRDWHCGKRDIDLVALAADMATIVFVEVKTRTSNDVAEPADAVNRFVFCRRHIVGYNQNFRTVRCRIEGKFP